MTTRIAVISVSGCGRSRLTSRVFALRMRQDESARQPLDTLQRDGALAAQLFAPSFPPCQNLGMAGFGLGETPLRAGRPRCPTLPGRGRSRRRSAAALRSVTALRVRQRGRSRPVARFGPRRGTASRACSLSQEAASGRDATSGSAAGEDRGTQVAEQIGAAQARGSRRRPAPP